MSGLINQRVQLMYFADKANIVQLKHEILNGSLKMQKLTSEIKEISEQKKKKADK